MIIFQKTRRAAHGKHECGHCYRRIAARSLYLDHRVAFEGTMVTQRFHIECDILVTSAVNYFDIDWEDLGEPGETVCDWQRDAGLPISWPPEVST